MPQLTIDNISVEVPPGTSVLEAAKKVGIWIPHFCYHPALGSVGACRLCAMKFLEGPVKGIQMSCMVPAQDGMVVSTTDGEAARLRQLVIEWLMVNHPHDCPVCDEGGECLLQDYTIAGGHGIRRYQGKKRTHLNQFLGEQIQHEMNRCIQCYRCVRFYQEYAGGSDFGVMGSAGQVYFGRQQDGPLESPFSGNLVDLCPTGVFTDKTARFRARYWDYAMAPSICPGCSLGCNTVPAAINRELLKTMARHNDAVNGWFICDRGRFNNKTVNDPGRPRTPLIDGRAADWDEALDALLLRVSQLFELYGEESLAVVGSSRLSLEGNILLAQLAALLGAGFLCFFNNGEESDRAANALAALHQGNTASMVDVRQADCVVILVGNLLEDGPLMALAVRQAWRSGAKIFSVGDAVSPELTKTLAIEATGVNSLAEISVASYRNPVIIGTTTHCTAAVIAAAAGSGARFACLLAGPNACGAALLANEHQATDLAAAIATGKVKGVISFEADIPPELLADVALLAAADWLPTTATAGAEIVLPTTAWVEMDGTFINFEGRAQRFKKVMNPGLPVKELVQEGQPSRLHEKTPPGSNVRPAWQVAAALIERLESEKLADPFAGKWEQLRQLDPAGEGVRVI